MSDQKTILEDEVYQDILRNLGLEDFPQAFQEEYMVRFGDMLFGAILSRVIPLMDAEQQARIEYFMTNEGIEGMAEAFTFMEDNVADFKQIQAEETQRILEAIKRENEEA